jgi:hypothetical protein
MRVTVPPRSDQLRGATISKVRSKYSQDGVKSDMQIDSFTVFKLTVGDVEFRLRLLVPSHNGSQK